jgi:Lrp/AsnC family leucine-responsive transcriptional regulator
MTLDSIDKNYSHYCKQIVKDNEELSLKLNLSVTAVYERIKKLEREGIIDKYVVLLNKAKSKRFVVFCHLKLIQQRNL